MELPDPDSMWGHTTKGLHDTKSVAAGTEVTRLIVRFQVTWSKHVAPPQPTQAQVFSKVHYTQRKCLV